MDPLEFFLIFLKATTFTFAGLGSLPLLQQDLVHIRGWATDAQLAKAVAVGRLSPGPNGMYVVSLGYLLMGWWGALLATLGSVLPPLIILPLAPVLRRTMHVPWVNGLMRGIALGSTGLMLPVGLALALPEGFALSNARLAGNIGLAVLAFAVTRTGRMHPALVLGGAGVLGMLLSFAGL